VFQLAFIVGDGKKGETEERRGEERRG
jgi:hypothetical protein